MRQDYPDARVLLIGSRARGDHRPDSDYDFVIVSAAFARVPPLWRGQWLYRAWATWLPPVDADLFCATPDEYARARERSTSWIRQAEQEALPL